MLTLIDRRQQSGTTTSGIWYIRLWSTNDPGEFRSRSFPSAHTGHMNHRRKQWKKSQSAWAIGKIHMKIAKHGIRKTLSHRRSHLHRNRKTSNEMEESIPRTRISLMYYSTSVLNHICFRIHQECTQISHKSFLSNICTLRIQYSDEAMQCTNQEYRSN